MVPAEVPIPPADLLVAPEVGAVSVILPTGVLDLVDYSSSSDSDPSEDSLPSVLELPLVLPFLCSDDSEADGPAEQRPERHGSLTPSFEFPLAPVVAPPSIHRRPAILVRPSEAVPFGRPYRTHPNGQHKLLTARKRVGTFLARRLAWRRVPHRSSDHHSSSNFTSDSSSFSSSSDSLSNTYSGSSSDSLSDSSLVHSSGCDASGQSHSGPSTRVTSPRSPTTLVPSSTPILILITPALADLPPRKRFRDSYLSEVSKEEHIEISTADAETIVDLGICEGVRAHTEDGIDMGIEIATSDIREDEEEFEVKAKVGQLVASGERVSLADRVRRLGRENLRVRALLFIKRDRVDSLHHHMALSQEEFRQVRRDRDDTRRRLRRLESFVERRSGFRPYDDDNGNGGNGNGGNGNGGNGNLNENGRGDMPIARMCTYQDFMKCQPLNFKGTEGVFGLIRWFEKMEIVFHISNCLEKYQVKYATCTLLNSALTWRNSHKRTVGTDTAFSMSWRELMKLMAGVYCLRNEIQKMESELWNLTVKNNDLAAYTQRFQELTILCTKMGNVIATEPTRLQDAVRIANNLMDQKLKGYTLKNAENKRKLEVNPRDNRGQQPPIKRPNVGGPCIVRCGKCNKVGHLTRDYKATNSTTSTQKGQVVNHRVVNCYECGRQRHYRSDCPKLKDQNCGNKNGIGEARRKAYMLGGGDANPDSNVVTDVSYAVELPDGRVSETNIVLRGCTLGLLGHLFNIDLLPVELGSFDVIIGMDWLVNHHAVIVCDEKIVRIPYGDEVLIVQGDRCGRGKKSKLSIKETKDKSEEKRLEDVPTVRDFSEVFLEYLPGLPQTR
ncbi:reverse transcriptase domain-containing protein [Tanacetum coccineum]